MYIYLIINKINFKKYVGCTTRNPIIRWGEHRQQSKRKRSSKNHLYNAFEKYGIDNFSFKILDSTDTRDKLLELEKYYIKELNTYYNGYNLTLGGEGINGWNPSNVWKNKQRILNSGSNNPNYGKHHSKETKNKQRLVKLGKKLTEEHKLKIKLNNARTGGVEPIKVSQYSLNNELIKTFSSLSQAARETNSDKSAITRAITTVKKNGKLRSVKGFIWKYA